MVFNFTFQIVFKDPHSTKKKFTIKDFFSKCDKICSFLWIWSHLPKKSLMENFIYCAVPTVSNKCKNVPPVLLKYSFSPEVVFGAKHLYISPFSPGIIIWKHRIISEQWNKTTSPLRVWLHKAYSYNCFDFPARSVFTFDVFWGRLGRILLGNSCSAANKTPSSLLSLWLCCSL